MQKHTVAIIGLGRMGSTIDDEGHGARLVGRFQTDDGLQIVAVWVY